MNVDVNAYLLSTLIQMLLGLLIFLGSSPAFDAFVGVAVICVGASYAMPVLLSVFDHHGEMRDAPYNLGIPDCFAVACVIFEIVLFSMPAVTSTSMSECS
jgi:hypothetical protein